MTQPSPLCRALSPSSDGAPFTHIARRDLGGLCGFDPISPPETARFVGAFSVETPG